MAVALSPATTSFHRLKHLPTVRFLSLYRPAVNPKTLFPSTTKHLLLLSPKFNTPSPPPPHSLFSGTGSSFSVRNRRCLFTVARALSSGEAVEKPTTEVYNKQGLESRGEKVGEFRKRLRIVDIKGGPDEGLDKLGQTIAVKGWVRTLRVQSSVTFIEVCLQVASSIAKRYSGSVVFVDTGNSLSPRRIAQIISQISDPADEEVNKILERVMKNIVCHGVFDIFTLLDVLNQLKSNFKSQISCQVRLLIVDSISSLITPILGGSGAHGHALMISAGFLLKELAHEHNLAIIVTNHMVGGEGGNLKPALGESWKSIPHVRLRLSRDQKSNICNMSILKHPYMASLQEVKFMIL